MGLYGDQTLSEAFGIPVIDGQTNIYYNDTTTNSGLLDADTLYRVSSNNDCHVAMTEDGAALLTAGQGMFLASGENVVVATDGKRKTIQVQRSTTGGTLFAVKLRTRGF